ncbi:MAG: type I DNA topoisomerase [Alphaproteobacteria bacterium]|nr:type I DNA topoisomerase [Alphaproteobacteria bacterium]
MSGHNVVVVESPAKAKTINKYLGSDYTVLASFGHVRDLPPKDGSVKPDENFEMAWELGERAGKPIAEIKKALKGADTLYLCTDPDREGEAISWHLTEILNTKGLNVHRVTFNEITKSAIKEAFEHPREVDKNLVEAYLARRALDYLVGFTISPVLWRKLPGSRSAGRVQSVALRLICERESEIEKFISEEYWTLGARLKTADGAPFMARLTHLSGNKLGKFDINNEKDAMAAKARIEAKNLKVTNIEAKQARRHPYAPFITSTLQMEASRKLGMSASETMRTAQRLYEGVDIGGETVGLITYMRTDGTTLSGEAVAQLRGHIKDAYGDQFVPDAPRLYKSKAKNAQEAHEAIRPTNARRTPEQVAKYLSGPEARLYELIWKRAVASQMESAIMDQTTVDISDGTDDVVLRATGSVVVFEGFLKLYEESHDDADENEENRRLPPMKSGDAIGLNEVKPEQHFTQPPPRYTEASLVKKLEEEGIGRPSTYASIIQVLQDRNYVRLEQKRFIPEDRGRIVTTFLTKYFTKYVDYKFTASLEEELDAISDGHVQWKEALRNFWDDFSKAVEGTKDLTITQVIDALDEELGPHFFPVREEGKDPRICPACGQGRLGLRLGKSGAFIGCSNYKSEPKCSYTTPLVVADGELSGLEAGPKELGTDVTTGQKVTLRKGPYGLYVQLGEGTEKEKPKRQGLPKNIAPDDVTLDVAMSLLALPRHVGNHPETGNKITAGIGRFGPYLKHGDTFKSIPKDDDVLTIGINRAMELLSQASVRGKRGAGAGKIKDVGTHPTTKEVIELYEGKYGPYVKMGKVNATLPKGADPKAITLEEAVVLIDKRAESAPASKGKKGSKKAAPKKESAPKAKKPKKAKAG